MVYAIGTTPKSLRKWLDRGELSFLHAKEGGWREFSDGDVIVLAITRRLVDFGFSVMSAADTAQDVLLDALHGLRDTLVTDPDMRGVNLMWALRAELMHRQLVCRSGPDGLDAEPLSDEEYGRFLERLANREERDPVLVISVGFVVDDAFNRLAERMGVAPEDLEPLWRDIDGKDEEA